MYDKEDGLFASTIFVSIVKLYTTFIKECVFVFLFNVMGVLLLNTSISNVNASIFHKRTPRLCICCVASICAQLHVSSELVHLSQDASQKEEASMLLQISDSIGAIDAPLTCFIDLVTA